MKIKIILFLLSIASCKAQKLPTKLEVLDSYGFKEDTIIRNNESILYYTYSKGNTTKNKIILYIQGSDPSPQFSYRIKDSKIQKLCWLNGEFKIISDEYLYVVVEKIGFEELIDEDNIPIPKIYQKMNSLQNRVFRINEVINYLTAKQQYEKVIVYGHSEGAPVAAKLAIINKKITHLGFWAGNALPDFYDFILENRRDYYKGEISDSTAQKRIDNLILKFKNISKDSVNTDGDGYTNLRWWSYAEPPIYNLLKIDIPIYVQVATKDKSAPIESTYLIPLEFSRLGKKNLTYKVCIGCNHGFVITNDQGNKENKWKEIFSDFIEWTNNTYPSKM